MKTPLIYTLFVFTGITACTTEPADNQLPVQEPISENSSPGTDVNETAMEMYERLLAGESFATLAMLYSQDEGSARMGGEIGWTARGELVEEYENIAYTLDINEISQPFQSLYGWHIVQLLDKNQDSIKTRHILITED